eukprot:SAG22_NODE_30_length_28348_cov_12.488584_4_plen_452_part_00
MEGMNGYIAGGLAAGLFAACHGCMGAWAAKAADGVLDATTKSIPVVGQNIVVGSKDRKDTKILVRPPHQLPPASWHKNPNLDAEGPLTKAQVKTFYEDGYLFLEDFYADSVVDGLLQSEQRGLLEDIKGDVERMIEDLAKRLYNNGKIKDLYAELDWTSRLLRMRQDFPDAPVILIKGGVLPAGLQKMFADEKMLDIAKQLGVGPEVALNAAWNLRGKMPSHEETVVPWHQDNSYWEPRIWDEQVLTVWVALVDANRQNGCMQMLKKGHASGKTASHTIGTSTATWYTEATEAAMATELLGKQTLEDGVDKIVVEAKAGSVLIFPGTTPHRSLNSTSANIRWSTDFRLHPKTAKRPGSTASELDWFYGLKDSLLLRDSKDGATVDPSFKPDWAAWAGVDRTEVQDAAKGKDAAAAKETFDPVIVGPWMDLWDIEVDNRPDPEDPAASVRPV